MENALYSWSFDDKQDRGTLWYTIMLSVVIGLVIWGFLNRWYGMSFIILLISGLFYFVENNSPDVVVVHIGENGVIVGEKLYEYTSMESFGYIYDHGNPILLRFNLTRKWMRALDVRIDSITANEVAPILWQFLEQTPRQDLSFTERLIKWMKL